MIQEGKIMFEKVVKLAICAGGLFMVTACATGTTNLSLGLTPDTVRTGLLSEVEGTTLTIASVDDEREAALRNRIGDKRNGYGMVMGEVGTDEPVVDIVKDTVVQTFEANGHDVAEEGGLQVDIDVNRFWFDYKTGLVTVEFFGDIQIDLTVTTAAGEVVFEDEFKGYYSDKTGGGLSGTWTRVMDEALSDLSKEISLSMELMEVLQEYGAAAPEGDAIS